MSVDGQDGPRTEVTTGLPQGSSVSPVLFAIYIAEIHGAVEDKVPGCQGVRAYPLWTTSPGSSREAPSRWWHRA